MSSVTSICNDKSKLNPLVRVMLEAALDDIKSNGVTPIVVETYRPKIRQYYLYGQGRTVQDCVNAGVPRKYAKEYTKPVANKVTWTLNSIHIRRKAVDVIPSRDGKAIWNSNDKDTKKIIEIMQKYGFEAGANWESSPDSPHFQVKGKFKNLFRTGRNTVYVTKVIQKALKKHGYYNGVVDGDWGKFTVNSINKWRVSIGYKKTGSIGKTALKKLLNYL